MLVGALFVASSLGLQSGIENTILHGVRIGEIRAALRLGELPDLTSEQLEGKVTSRLQQAGIRVAPDGTTLLWIEAILVNDEPPTCFASVQGRLLEDARLERNGRTVQASSWEGYAIVSTSADRCSLELGQAVENVTSQFIEMYEAMNPRQ